MEIDEKGGAGRKTPDAASAKKMVEHWSCLRLSSLFCFKKPVDNRQTYLPKPPDFPELEMG